MLVTSLESVGADTWAVSKWSARTPRRIATIVRSAPGAVTVKTGRVSITEMREIVDHAEYLEGKKPHNCTCKRQRRSKPQ
jgi:hypothetical protein